MPFVETYAVDFAGGNFCPRINLLGWPHLKRVVTPSDALSEYSSDLVGITLKVTRAPGAQSPHVFHSLVLIPPSRRPGVAIADGSLPIGTRFFTTITFDRPSAEPPPQVKEPGVAARVVEGSPLDPHPEPWAVALNISPDPNIPSDPENAMVDVTCQFNRKTNGIRLNTPSGILTDQSANLETPLNYALCQEPAVFTLKHSFVGSYVNPAPGAGSLTIARPAAPEVKDHRVYSTTALRNAHNAGPFPRESIGALGVSLVTLTGVGWISVRLRSFSVWCNPGLSIPGIASV